MNKKVIVLAVVAVTLVVYAWFGILDRENPLQVLEKEPQEISGEVTSFYVARPNLVVETVGLDSVNIFATPADRQEEDFILGEAVLVEEFGKRRTWTLAIPEQQLIRKIYTIGTDSAGVTTERTVFPIAGIAEIYESLWENSPEIVQEFTIEEEYVIDGKRMYISKILEESRCPIAVTCIQAGRLVIEFVIEDELSKDLFVVSSNDDELRVNEYFIKILKVLPIAQEGDISVQEYNITLSIISSTATSPLSV